MFVIVIVVGGVHVVLVVVASVGISCPSRQWVLLGGGSGGGGSQQHESVHAQHPRRLVHIDRDLTGYQQQGEAGRQGTPRNGAAAVRASATYREDSCIVVIGFLHDLLLVAISYRRCPLSRQQLSEPRVYVPHRIERTTSQVSASSCRTWRSLLYVRSFCGSLGFFAIMMMQ